MNQKDYNAIGEIIKDFFDNMNTILTLAPFVKRLRILLVDKLADYFEREDKKWCYVQNKFVPNKIFNREQFLKDCGVTK